MGRASRSELDSVRRGWYYAAMPTLTYDTREAIRRARSEAAKAETRYTRSNSLRDACLEAAAGDPYLALSLAIAFVRANGTSDISSPVPLPPVSLYFED